MKCLEQGQAPHIPDENVAMAAHNVKNARQNAIQIADVGKVLNDRIQNDRIKRPLRKSLEIVCALLEQLNFVKIGSAQLAANVIKSPRREISPHIAFAFRSNPQQQ